MALTCLEIIQTVCDRVGITRPSAAITSTDAQIIQLVALSNQEGQALVKRYPNWESLRAEATFTTLAAQLQGTVASIASGMRYIVNNTMWNRTKRIPILGSVSTQDWQQIVALGLTTPYSQYRIMNNSIYFYPVPAAGDTVAFEYVSKNWVTVAAGGTASKWSADADTPLVNDELIIAGTVWRWKMAKGLDYAEDFATYESDLVDEMNRDGTKPILSTNNSPYDIQPAVIIPSGSWAV